MVGTDSCEAHHVGVIVAGTLHVVHNDGTSAMPGRGCAYGSSPATTRVVGDDPVVAYEFDSSTAETYAQSS